LRYDFWKDVSRLEAYIQGRKNTIAYVILLTNDYLLLASPRNLNSNDADFATNEGRLVTNQTMKWADGSGPGTTKGRENAISLLGRYALLWNDYSNINDDRLSGKFRYLLLKIQRDLSP